MAPLWATVLSLALLSSANAQRPTNKEWKEQRAKDNQKAAEDAADAGKRSAVDKVINMLEDLTAKVQAEGEKEAASYNKFACFCKDGQREKSKSIKENKDAKMELSAAIEKLSTGRKEDDKTIEGLEKDIEGLNKDMKKASEENAKEVKTYEEEEADLSSAIEAIANAIQVLKASKPSLLQLKSASKAVREAVAMADALGFGVDTLQGPGAALLQQAPDVEMENYKFHASGVIGTLEKLQGEFRKKKAKTDETEVKRVQEHNMETQTNTDKVKAKTLELGDTQKARDDKIAAIAESSQKLTIASSDLLDDSIYLKELYEMCSKKADTWDVRSKVRADELSALTAATSIVKGAVAEKTSRATLRFAQRGVSVRLAEAVARDENAMDAMEADAEEKEAQSSAIAFLQRRSVSRHDPQNGGEEAVDRISKLLKQVAGKTKSTLLTGLASEISTGKPKGMEKIKTLIEELIKRLQAEAASEATQKGWCDKSMSDANTKKISTSSAVDELNDSLATLEADRKLLKDMLDKLADDIQELKDKQDEADKMRKEEKEENENTVKEAKEGQKAVESAIDILDKFYKKAKESKVLVQVAQTGPKDDAPDAGFDGGEAYKGDQSSATGVLGMLDVIKSDFVRTIKETEKAETEADQDYQGFTESTKTSLKEKEGIEKARKKEKADADSKFNKQTETLGKKMDLLVSTVEELMELKKTCVDTGMSYEDRMARRDQEVAALRKALCILTAYASYGPNAAEYDQC